MADDNDLLEQFAARGMAAQTAVNEVIDAHTLRWHRYPGLQYDRERELMQLTLYRRPLDFPDGYVITAWFVSGAGVRQGPKFGFFGDEAEAKARGWIAQEFPDLVPLSRDPHDDPHVVAVWT